MNLQGKFHTGEVVNLPLLFSSKIALGGLSSGESKRLRGIAENCGREIGKRTYS